QILGTRNSLGVQPRNHSVLGLVEICAPNPFFDVIESRGCEFYSERIIRIKRIREQHESTGKTLDLSSAEANSQITNANICTRGVFRNICVYFEVNTLNS